MFTATDPSSRKPGPITGTEQLQRLRLLRLCSPTLPIGSFTWSQGLETAIERGWIRDAESAIDWIRGCLWESFAPTEGALLLRMLRALRQEHRAAFAHWNDQLLALRETAEFHKEDTEQGALLHQWNALHHPSLARLVQDYTLTAAFAEALQLADIQEDEGLLGFLWMWAETQVTQVIKLIPLGLRDGQRLLDQLLQSIPQALTISWECPDEDVGLSLPGRTLASMFHESQYCRIYRS